MILTSRLNESDPIPGLNNPRTGEPVTEAGALLLSAVILAGLLSSLAATAAATLDEHLQPRRMRDHEAGGR